jgi:hypothetical protein
VGGRVDELLGPPEPELNPCQDSSSPELAQCAGHSTRGLKQELSNLILRAKTIGNNTFKYIVGICPYNAGL